MAKTQPNIDDIKGLTQWINFLWLKLKDLFSAESETTNDNYLPKIDDVNKKLVKSNISDDGTTPKYGDNTIWHSGNLGYAKLGDMPVATESEVGGIKLGFVPELDADLLDGKHASNDTDNIPISNGTVNTDLNADLLDDKHASDFATHDHAHTNLEVTTSLGYTPYNATNPDGYTSNLGTVTAVKGTSPIISTEGTTPTISLKVGHADDVNPFSSKPANHVYAAPNGVAGTPSFRALVASDIPTLNQNTTGNAATASSATKLTNSREINGVSFDGTEDITIPVGHETIQPLSSMLDTLNNLADGIYQLQAPTDTYPDSVCGNIVGTVIPEGTEILRQYTVVNAGNQDHKTQIMLIQNETYRRSGLGNYWNEWVRLITCRDMANYATIDMLETSDGEYLEPYNSVDVYRDTTYTINGKDKEGKYIIVLKPLFTNPPLEIIEIYIVISPQNQADYILEIQLSEYDIDTRESSSSTTAHFGDTASITIPQLTSFVLLKIYMWSNVKRCLIVYTFS